MSNIVSIGGLWAHKDKAGGAFLAGEIQMDKAKISTETGKMNIMVFKNKFKEKGTKQPDYKITQIDDSAEAAF